jgi:DNA repair protein RecN (Recombination protein N)
VKKSSLYLSSLRLNNFATFRDEEILFENGFNAIIGETGSGKSLVLDALQLVFGMRADKNLFARAPILPLLRLLSAISIKM